jgi:hypothetical protein
VGLLPVVKEHSSRVPARRRVTLLLVGVVPLALAACGSAAASSSSTTKPSGTASRAAYTACLKQHGVTLPTFGGRPGGPGGNGGTGTGGESPPPSFTPGSGSFPRGGGGFADNPKFKAAAAACKSLRPSGGFGGGGGFGGSGGFNSTAFAAYRNCLKLHGVTLPTGRFPGATGGTTTTTTGSTPSTTFNPQSPTVQAAEAACAALRPTSSTTTTTTAA